MKDQLNKIIDLIQKTGDKCVIFDPEKGIYVVMAFNDYEKLVTSKSEVHDLTEGELLDKINRDVAIWRSSQQNDQAVELEETIKAQLGQEKKEKELENTEDRYYFEPLE